MVALDGSNPSNPRPIEVLPEPDSPTSASVSPGYSSKLTLRTAWIGSSSSVW